MRGRSEFCQYLRMKKMEEAEAREGERRAVAESEKAEV